MCSRAMCSAIYELYAHCVLGARGSLHVELHAPNFICWCLQAQFLTRGTVCSRAICSAIHELYARCVLGARCSLHFELHARSFLGSYMFLVFPILLAHFPHELPWNMRFQELPGAANASHQLPGARKSSQELTEVPRSRQ